MGAWAPSIKLGDIFKLMQTATPWTHVPDLLHRRQQGVHTHNRAHAMTALSATIPDNNVIVIALKLEEFLTLAAMCPRLWEGDVDHDLIGRSD